MVDSRAVAIAQAHLEAWTNHDLETARGNLAEDVKFHSPAGTLEGPDEYMDAPRGLVQFARQVVPGSLPVIAAMADERNALIMSEVDPETTTLPPTQTWLADDIGQIQVGK